MRILSPKAVSGCRLRGRVTVCGARGSNRWANGSLHANMGIADQQRGEELHNFIVDSRNLLAERLC